MMNRAFLRKLVAVPPHKLHALLGSRGTQIRGNSTVSNEVTIDPSVLARYDGSIVISGISGRFPSAHNTTELTEKLLRGEELMSLTSTRWPNDYLPERFGYLDCLNEFDANFFGLTPRQAHATDPQMRILLEAAFEAVIDAGICPTTLRGSRTAVFSGAYGGEATDYTRYRFNQDMGGYLGVSSVNFMIPARIAFALDLQGPSSHMCTACSSSFTALETAVHSIILGKCDAAIVTGSTVHLNPHNHMDLIALNALAKDGRCKTFDEKADGFARSEAAVAILIQKEKDAKRNYARILQIRSNTDGFKHTGLMYPNREVQERLLRESYHDAQIDPATIEYLEAHGTGTPTGDPEELNSAHNVYCKGKGRTKPLLIGSVKSNMGHPEAAAGFCGIAKVIGTIQTRTIPPSIHFNKPRPEEEHLFDGSMKVVTEPTPFDGGMIGINSFGIGGTNYHCILQPGRVNEKVESTNDLPILLPVSGRTQEQVEASIKEAAQSGYNPEFAYLVQNAFQKDISGNSYRGFGLLKAEEEVSVSVQKCDSTLRPVWIVFPGMGSQWNEMGKDLMKIGPFAESILRSRATLKNIGVDLDELLKPNYSGIFDDIHLAVLSITAMQLALYDTIKELGLLPEGFIGHSTGEFLCAYADGCFTAEETLLVTDARGRAFKESQKVIGGMASVGMSWEEVKARLPTDVELACHNAAQNVTVSGPAEAVNKFVEELKSEEKFATAVNSCGIAAHSKYVQDAADLLKVYVRDIIKGERPRSSRWISTSIPEKDWDSPMAKFASPEYFDNNLRAPVLFYEALQHVPSKALVVEVSPKGFFQALLKETVPSDCVHVAPMTVKAEDKLTHFFQSVGEIFLAGLDVRMEKLYPVVSTPVSSTTPSLSPLVKWDHSVKWNDCILKHPFEAGMVTDIDLQIPKYAVLAGHKIENRILFPATGYIQLAWVQLASYLGTFYENCPVEMQNVQLKRATILSEQRSTELFTTLSGAGGQFWIENEGDIVVTGHIKALKEGEAKFTEVDVVPTSDYLPLNKDDVYKEFRLRGYNYTGAFQGIERLDNEGHWADVVWKGNWVTFLDTVLQAALLCTTLRNLAVPVDFEKIIIDPIAFKNSLKEPEEGQEDPLVRVHVLPYEQKIICPGVEFKGLQPTIMPRKGQRGNLAYEKYTFRPFFESAATDNVEEQLWEMVDLVLDNNRSKDLKVIDIFSNKEHSLAGKYQNILALKPMRESDVRMLTLASEVEKMDDKEKQVARAIVTKETKEQLVPDYAADLVFLDDPSLLSSVSATLKQAGFVLVHSEEAVAENSEGIELLSQKKLETKTMSLFRRVESELPKVTHVRIDDAHSFAWVAELQEAVKKPVEGQETARIYVTSQGNDDSGVLGLVNCLRQEDGGERIRCIFDPENKVQLDFENPSDELKSILTKDLITTVVKNNQFGSYRHIPLEAETHGVLKNNVDHAYVGPLTPGDLTSLRWIESPLVNFKETPEKKLYKIAYSSINFRDVLLATGTIPLSPEYSYKGPFLGFEFSGYDSEGKRVMGIGQGNAMATTIACDPRFVFPVPDDWTLEQAATVPIVYATVLYAFHERGRIKPGQTVLVHAGSGGVGQAAISVALAQGCTVLTTVGTPEKREFIKKTFPQIKDEHIGNSRDTSFESQFMRVTKGRGVDIVLNSLAGDKLLATVRCLAVNGKFLEIGVFDAFMNTPMGLRPFLKNIDFSGIELYHVLDPSVGSEKELQKLMDDALEKKAVRPLPTHVYERDQVEDAFRFMATGKHMGKIVLKIRDEMTWNEPLNLAALGRCYFSQEKTYLIVGGLGGLGLEVANWMVDRGARHLVLTSRSGVTTGYQSLCLRKWKELGVTVETPAIDLSNREAAEEFLQELTSKHKLGGIFNSALVLKDEAFPNQTVEAFEEVAAPKATVTRYLDELLRKHCPNLDYFVVFSSSACGRGNADQTNYGWANSVMERICEKRMADGLHGLAIQWGVLGQVGVVAEKLLKNMDDNSELLGTLPQNVESCLEVLDAALQQRNPLVSSIVVAEKGKKRLDKAGLLARMQKIFGITDIESLNPDKKLSELGMDSLVAVELKQTLEREYDMTVTKELLLSLTVGDLKAIDAGTFDPSRAGKGGEVKVPFKMYDECLVKLNAEEDRDTVFIVHGLEGSCDGFRPLADRLNANVYGFQFAKDVDPTSVEAVADYYVKEMKSVQPVGPYNVYGYSGGCPIALEIAQLLRLKHNEEVQNLVFLDGCPSYAGYENEEARRSMAYHLLESRDLLKALPADRQKKLKESFTGEVETDTKILLDLAREFSAAKPDPVIIGKYLQLGLSVHDYKPVDKYPGNVVLIAAKEPSIHTFTPGSEDYALGEHCYGPISRHDVDGDHWSFLKEEKVSQTAQLLNASLFPRREGDNGAS